jgi:F0F1-type ATP synthase membrane subunit b/b'
VKRRAIVRRIALAIMLAVTAWSLWVWAQPRPAGSAAKPMLARPTAPAAKPTAAMGSRPAAAGAPGAAGAGEETETEEPAPFNWTDFGQKTPPYIAMLINFGILVAGYYLLGKKGITEGLQARRDHIAKDIEDAQRMRHEAEERAKKYQVKLEHLEHEVVAAREALLRSGEAERDRIVKEAETKAERMRKDAEFLVQQELKQIRIDLWRDAVDTAVTAAEELLKKRVTPADQERLAEDYLADLGGPSGTAP